MSISQALNTSLSGLRATQAGLSLIASNVANAQTPGYVRKTLQLTTSAAGDGGSVRVGDVNRELDQYLQRQLRVEIGGRRLRRPARQFYQRLQGLYGAPGSDSSLETAFNNFTGAVQSLVTSPDSTAARSVVLSNAQVLAQTLNSLTTDIQALRGDAETGLADSVAAANNALKKIDELNRQLAGVGETSASDAALMDQRDNYIDQLSQLMDIRVVTDNRNQVTVFTNSGIQLVGSGAAQLSFNAPGHGHRGDPVGCRSDQEQPRQPDAGVGERLDGRSDRQPVDPLGQDRRLSRHARQRPGAGAEPDRQPGRDDGAGAVERHHRRSRRHLRRAERIFASTRRGG